MVVLAGSLLALAGCQATAPTAPSGVLSVIHQKALERATHQAVEATALCLPEGQGIALAPVDGNDLGKKYVAQVLEGRFPLSATSAGDAANTGVTCQILLAGVDVTTSGFLFVRTVRTNAEVQLRFRDPASDPCNKEGTGTASYNQTWIFGLGPSVKWE